MRQCGLPAARVPNTNKLLFDFCLSPNRHLRSIAVVHVLCVVYEHLRSVASTEATMQINRGHGLVLKYIDSIG